MERNAELREVIITIIEQHSVTVGINDRYYNATRINKDAGEGNYSLVFKSDDRVNGGNVALKFFDPQVRDEYRRDCFQRESANMEILKGQSDILQLVEGRTFCTIPMTYQPTNTSWPITLEFIATVLAKSNVRRYIYESEVDPMKNLEYFRGMCRSVQRVHKHNMRHRDLKPENFFLDKKYNIMLGDFGTSRVFREGILPLSDRYEAGLRWRGDTLYTAPELFGFANETAELFRRAEFYSLGAILFELFTKQQLYAYVFNERFNRKLEQILRGYPSRVDGRLLAQTAAQISKETQLPEIYDFDIDIPLVVKNRLNNLYKCLANPDYTKRTCDFEIIFLEIDRCANILQNQKKYMKLMELRKLWRERHKERIRRQQDTRLNVPINNKTIAGRVKV